MLRSGLKLIATTILTSVSGFTLHASSSACESMIDAIQTKAVSKNGALKRFTDCAKEVHTQVEELLGLLRPPTAPVGTKTDDQGTWLLADSKAFESDRYFGWRKGDSLNLLLIRMESSIEILLESTDRANFGITRGEVRKSMGLLDATEEARYEDAKIKLTVARSRIVATMEDRGLTEPFSAVLDTYFVPFSTAGSNQVSNASTGTNSRNQTFASGSLSFESEHFRTKWIRFGDLSIGGRIGLAPTQTIVTVNGLEGEESKRPRTFLQNAFNWSFNARTNIPLGKKSDFAPFVSFGQTLLLQDTVAVGPDSSNTTTLYRNNTSTHARFLEKGVEVRIYSLRRERVRSEKKYLLPKFSFATGHRIDERFAGLESENFNRPRQRWFLRGFVMLTNVGERNPSGQDKANPFNVSVGIEYDAPWGAGQNPGLLRVPTNSRIYINASLDLVGAFGKQAKK